MGSSLVRIASVIVIDSLLDRLAAAELAETLKCAAIRCFARLRHCRSFYEAVDAYPRTFVNLRAQEEREGDHRRHPPERLQSARWIPRSYRRAVRSALTVRNERVMCTFHVHFRIRSVSSRSIGNDQRQEPLVPVFVEHQLAFATVPAWSESN